MIRTLFILIALSLTADAQIISKRKPVAAAAGVSYLVSEDFEGTGAPSGWGSGAGTVDYDYTTSPLQGSQSLHCTSTGAGFSFTQCPTYASSADLWIYFMMRVDTVNSGAATFGNCINIGDFEILDSTLTVRINDNSTGTYTATGMTTGSNYHIWVHCNSTGESSMAWSSDGIKPTGGNQYAAHNNPTSVASTRSYLSANNNWVITFDKFRISTSVIGDNPN